MYFGLNGGSGGSGGCGGVFQKTFLVRDKGGVFRGGWWCFGLVGGGIFDLGGDFAVVVKVEVEDFELVVKIFETGLGLFKWGDVYLLGSQLNVSGRENVQH